MTLKEIGGLILRPEVECLFSGNYTNRRGIRGYYVQLASTNIWCRVSVSHADRHSDRISVSELEAAHTAVRQTGVFIPTRSIAKALESEEAQGTPIRTYFNSAGIRGMWAEFYYEGNWYMLNISQVDAKEYLRQNHWKKDRITNEFLREQGKKYRRRSL